MSDAESDSERELKLDADLDDLEIGGAVSGLQRPVQRGEKVEEDGDESSIGRRGSKPKWHLDFDVIWQHCLG